MPRSTTLDTLTIGTHARLLAIEGERAFRRRLLEMGLLPGGSLQVIRRVDVGGLIELEVRRTRVTVRRNEAASIRVEVLLEGKGSA